MNIRMKINDNKLSRVPYVYIVIFLIIGACIALTGYQHHKNFEKHFRTNVENQLQIIADLKVNELKHWLEERQGDANTLLGNKVFSKVVKQYFKNPNDHTIKSEIQEWMKEFQYGYNYNAVILVDPQLVKKIVIPELTERPKAYISLQKLDSIRAGKLVLEDFYYDEVRQKVFLKILIPILDVHQLIGILELRIDPKNYLYPALKNWPMPGKTSETFILRREDNHAVYLSELKFQKNTILNLRIPLENTNVMAVRAVLGYNGFMEGIDYRGEAVIAYINKVPNSPWFLIAQSDESEVYAPLKNDLLQTVILGLIMFLLAGFGLGFIWRNQRTQIYKERIVLADALRNSEERFRSLYENSTMGIYRTTPEGKIILANDTLIRMLGYASFEELSSIDLDKDDYEPNYDRQQFIEQMETNGEVIGLEAQWTRKDGRSVYIRESARAIRDLNHKTLYYDGTVENITEIKKSELERQVIYEITKGVTTTENLNDLLKLIHQSLGKLLYTDNYFIALHDQVSGLFSFPYFVDQFDSTPEPVEMAKSCTAYVFRTGKPILITPELFQQLKKQNEVELVGSPSPSWVGVPLQTPARTIGVLVLQHYEKENVFSERDILFLASAGSQIAMAIDRKRAEEDLRNEKFLLRTVIDNIPDSIYSKDKAYRKTLANLTELNYLGAKSETEILGKTDFDLYPKELAEGFFADDQLVIQTGRPVINREEFVIDISGQKHWLLTSKLPIMDEFGKITGLVGIGRDITTRRQAEEDLRESEIKLNTILQSTADGILAVNGNGKVIKTNRRFAELWQIPQPLVDSGDDDALISFVLDQLTNPDEFISKVQKLYHSMDEDLDFLHFKDGRTFERFSAPLVMDDSSIGRVWSFRDITSAKRAEEEIRKRNDELSKMNAEKDKFFSIIAHDLRSPFNGFLGLTQIMEEDLPTLTMDEIQKIATSLRNSATNLFLLLENLLEWAKIQQGLIPFEPKTIKLLSIVDECISAMLETSKNKEIELTYDFPENISVFADRYILQTVIRNLVSNALKFTPRGGKVSLSAKNSDNNCIELSIRDTGIGMSSKMVENLFRLDVQTNRKGTENEPSSGLGLMLCKEFIERHGGNLWIESENGKGSTFYFTIPNNTNKGDKS